MMQNNHDLRLFRIWNKATQAIMKRLHQDIKSYDISVENFQVLELLYSKGSHNVQKISEILNIPSGSITYVVNQLEQEGYVERVPCKKDRRSSFVQLKNKGQVFFDEIFPQHILVHSEIFSPLSDEEKELFMGLIKKVGLSL